MIYYTPRLGCCPMAMAAARRANAELLRKKHTTIKRVDRYLEAMFNVEDGKVNGIICLYEEEVQEGFYVSIAWVDESARSTGVFKKLMNAAITHAKSNNAKYINTEVRSKNVRMLEVMSRHWDTSYVFFTKKL